MAEIEIRIAKPCKQSWSAMDGNERVRFCGVCQTNVFNISEMTTAEVEELIRKTNGVFCARLYRRSDNRVMTKDCPKGVTTYRRKRTFALLRAGATMVLGASLTGCMGSTGGDYNAPANGEKILKKSEAKKPAVLP